MDQQLSSYTFRILALLIAGFSSTGLLSQTVHAQTEILAGHSDPVYAIEFSRDGKQLVTGSIDKTIRIWDSNTLKTTRTMTGHTGIVLSVKISPDGKYLASSSIDNTIKLWDMPINSPLTSHSIPGGGIAGLALSPDGKSIFAGGMDGTARLVQLADGKVASEIKPPQMANISKIVVRSDGKQAAIAYASGSIVLQSLPEGKVEAVLGAHPSRIVGLAYGPGASFLLSAGADGVVKRWPVTVPATRVIAGLPEGTPFLRLSPNGQLIATASADKIVRIWNYANGQLIRPLEAQPEEITALSFHPGSSIIATGGKDKIARLFDVGTGKLIKAFAPQAGPITKIAVSPNGQFVSAGDLTGTIRTVQISDGKEIRTLAAHAGSVTGLEYTENGNQFASVGADKFLHVWNVADGKEILKFSLPAASVQLAVTANGQQWAVAGDDHQVRIYQRSDGKLLSTLMGTTKQITSLEFSRDGTKLVASSQDGVARIWDVKSGLHLEHFSQHTGAVSVAAFPADGRAVVTAGVDKTIRIAGISTQLLHVADAKSLDDMALTLNGTMHATACPDGAIKIWTSSNGAPVRVLAGGHVGAARVVAWSANNQLLASSGSDKSIVIWQENTGKIQRKVTLPSETTRLAFSPDGTKLVAACADHAVRVFDAIPPTPQPAEPAPLEISQTFTGHASAISSLAILPDNKTVVSGSLDGTMKTWAAASPRFIANLAGHSAQIYGLAFRPDGKMLVSAAHDKTIRLWDVEKKIAAGSLSGIPEAYSADYSPDGKMIVAGLADKSVRLYQADPLKEVAQHTGAEYALYSTVFSPDGKLIAAGGAGLGTARNILIWNSSNPTPAKTLAGHKDDIYRVQFNTTGTRLLSIGYSGQIFIWDVASGKPLFSHKLPVVCLTGSYFPDGKRVVICANDNKCYLFELPMSAQ